jgi:cytochrome oxidase assembly protein ShyY1
VAALVGLPDKPTVVTVQTGVLVSFQPGWRMTVLLLVGLPVLLSLGNWQLQRAEEKRRFELNYLQAQSALPVRPGLADEQPPFTRLRLRGRYDADRQFLLDNQVRDGQIGYWVVTPFRDVDGRNWLVNRGWVAAAQRRDQLPDLVVDTDPEQIVAVVWPDTGLIPALAEERWPSQWPLRIQRLDVDKMAPLVDAVPMELRLEAGQPGVLAPAPVLMTVRASKHTGYAMQWFAFAGVLMLGFLIYGFTMPKRRARLKGSEDV